MATFGLSARPRAVLPAAGPGRGSGGRGVGRGLWRDIGDRLLRCIPPLPRLEAAVPAPPVAGHPQAESVVPGRPGLGQVGPWGAAALHQGRELGGGWGLFLTGQLALEKRLLKLCRPFLEDPSAVQGKLCRRIERHIKELFVFVSHPETPWITMRRSGACATW